VSFKRRSTGESIHRSTAGKGLETCSGDKSSVNELMDVLADRLCRDRDENVVAVVAVDERDIAEGCWHIK
jgi:hypothetical protein